MARLIKRTHYLPKLTVTREQLIDDIIRNIYRRRAYIGIRYRLELWERDGERILESGFRRRCNDDTVPAWHVDKSPLMVWDLGIPSLGLFEPYAYFEGGRVRGLFADDDTEGSVPHGRSNADKPFANYESARQAATDEFNRDLSAQFARLPERVECDEWIIYHDADEPFTENENHVEETIPLAKSAGRGKWKSMPGNAFTLNQHILYDMWWTPSEFHIPYSGIDEPGHFTNVPRNLISYKDMKNHSADDLADSYVHFWVPDYSFESLWKTPTHCEKFQACAGILGFDFSVYSEQPKALNIWNIYRSRWLSRFCEQELDIPVIPSVVWCKGVLDFCFDGILTNACLAISTVGAYRKEYRADFIDGFEEMIKRLSPHTLLVYGEFMPLRFEDYCAHVVYYETEWAKKRRRIHDGKGTEQQGYSG
jgi:hypothetical protein